MPDSFEVRLSSDANPGVAVPSGIYSVYVTDRALYLIRFKGETDTVTVLLDMLGLFGMLFKIVRHQFLSDRRRYEQGIRDSWRSPDELFERNKGSLRIGLSDIVSSVALPVATKRGYATHAGRWQLEVRAAPAMTFRVRTVDGMQTALAQLSYALCERHRVEIEWDAQRKRYVAGPHAGG